MGCARPSRSQQWVSESSCRVINPARILTSLFQVNHPLFDRNWSNFQKVLCFVFLEKLLKFFKHVLISTYSNTLLCVAQAVLQNWFCAVSSSEWPTCFFLLWRSLVLWHTWWKQNPHWWLFLTVLHLWFIGCNKIPSDPPGQSGISVKLQISLPRHLSSLNKQNYDVNLQHLARLFTERLWKELMCFPSIFCVTSQKIDKMISRWVCLSPFHFSNGTYC